MTTIEINGFGRQRGGEHGGMSTDSIVSTDVIGDPASDLTRLVAVGG